MYRIEDFIEYDGRQLNNSNAVLTWCNEVGYQFMMLRDTKDYHDIVGYRP